MLKKLCLFLLVSTGDLETWRVVLLNAFVVSLTWIQPNYYFLPNFDQIHRRYVLTGDKPTKTMGSNSSSKTEEKVQPKPGSTEEYELKVKILKSHIANGNPTELHVFSGPPEGSGAGGCAGGWITVKAQGEPNYEEKTFKGKFNIAGTEGTETFEIKNIQTDHASN